MQKADLLEFIKLYNLGGEIESTVWETNNTELSTRFITGDKSMIGDVSMKFVGVTEFGNNEFGVLTTKLLINMLSIFGSKVVNVKPRIIEHDGEKKAASLHFDDGDGSKMDFMLADISTVQRSKGLKQMPEMWDLRFDLSTEFIDKYNRSKSALSMCKIFTLAPTENGYNLIFGYSAINTNRVYVPMSESTGENNVDRLISFNAGYMKNILSANKDAKVKQLLVSNEGLAWLHFEDEKYETNYYLVEAVTDSDETDTESELDATTEDTLTDEEKLQTDTVETLAEEAKEMTDTEKEIEKIAEETAVKKSAPKKKKSKKETAEAEA